MEVSKTLSEVAGMFAADGCLQPGYVCMWGNIYQDKDYYNLFVSYLFEKEFNVSLNLHEKKSNSVYGFYLCRRKLVKFFNEELGFPIGSKTYVVEVPKLIIESKNKDLYTSFIRGFFDCDGCLSFDRRRPRSLFNRTFHVYPRVQIKCASKKIIWQMSDILKFLEIHNTVTIMKSRKSNEVDQYQININGSYIESFVKKIGFRNPVHITKYLIWKKYGFCPTKTTLEQRRNILKGNLDPYKLYGPVAQPG